MNSQDIKDNYKRSKEEIESYQKMIQSVESTREHIRNKRPDAQDLISLLDIAINELNDLKELTETYCSRIIPYALPHMSALELGETGRKEAIPYLINKIQELDYDSRRLGASAIGKLSDFKEEVAKAKPYLLANLHDPGSQVRNYTLKALEKMDLTIEDVKVIQQLKPLEDKEYNIKVIDRIIHSFESLNDTVVVENAEIPPGSLCILKVIGETGVSRTKEMERIAKATEEGQRYFFKDDEYHNSYFQRSLKFLIGKRYVHSKTIHLEEKGDGLVLELTESGKELFYSLTGKTPVSSEVSSLNEKYDTEKQAYVAHIVSKLFKDKGYHVTEYSRQTLPNGDVIHIDLVIEKDNDKQFILIDSGERNDEENLFEKLNKMYALTKEIHFVAPNEKILYQCTKGEVFKWITNELGGFENLKGKITCCFSTIGRIENNDEPWEKFGL
ncbi:hypothetical protein COA01_23080 [Bacillus cereus]|uniref:HEAT repeat domain-containing protein n=1 Tax=Bacillus cereus TaxID=1396 RepID=UPI000BFC2492|nr:HEAT repeat domain-containing protein [Bacillus cereus]PGP18629.1 hypothetical protein COA01_23080 [Bacillus cereus]